MPVNPSAECADKARPVPGAPPGRSASRHGRAEDDLLAFLLINTWTLITGRILRSDVPPTQLSEDELIAFWADDHIVHADAGPSRCGVVRTRRR